MSKDQEWTLDNIFTRNVGEVVEVGIGDKKAYVKYQSGKQFDNVITLITSSNAKATAWVGACWCDSAGEYMFKGDLETRIKNAGRKPMSNFYAEFAKKAAAVHGAGDASQDDEGNDGEPSKESKNDS